MASVSFDDVAKVYPDGTRAVSDFDLEISDGEFMVLVGPSGSGKTTRLAPGGPSSPNPMEPDAVGDATIARATGRVPKAAPLFPDSRFDARVKCVHLYPTCPEQPARDFGTQLGWVEGCERRALLHAAQSVD